MSQTKLSSVPCILASLLAALLVLTAGEAIAGNENDSLFAGQYASRERGSIWRSLLTWSKDDDGAKDNGDDDDESEDDEPLESDRPDFTETTSTVGTHRLQLEGGYTFTQAVGGDRHHDAHDLPELLVRFGVAERLELRFAWSEGTVFDRYVDARSGRVTSETGSTDLETGFKYEFVKQKRWRPNISTIVAVSIPMGDEAQSSRHVDTNLNLLYSWDITEKISLSCSTGNLNTAESRDHYSQLYQSAAIGYELTEKLKLYSECYGLFRHRSEDNHPQYYYDGGVTYLLTRNCQLDWRAGVGLNDFSDGFFTGAGLVIRR